MTKNLQGPAFEKHISKLVCEDEYMREATGRAQGEGVTDGLFAPCGTKTAAKQGDWRSCGSGRSIGRAEVKDGVLGLNPTKIETRE
jgi:hypothetical protein